MEQETIDRQKLAAYLLGRLPAAEENELADRYFSDDAFFAQLQDVENDLIDHYVRDQLPDAERRQLESYLSRHPDSQHKIIVACALAEVVAQREITYVQKPETSTLAAIVPSVFEPTGLWQILTAAFKQPIFAAACAMGLLFFGGFLTSRLLRNQQLSQDNQQLRAEAKQREEQQAQFQQKVSDLEQQMTDRQTLATKLKGDLNLLWQELRREQQLRESLSQIRVPNNPNSGTATSWILASIHLRDPFAPPDPAEVMRLGEKTKTVALTIPVKGNQKYSGYEVELKTADGKQILWKDAWPQTPPPRAGRDIVFYRPASEFTAASYKLTLTLISNSEPMTRDHYFTVIKQ